jgi:hypothetical protein
MKHIFGTTSVVFHQKGEEINFFFTNFQQFYSKFEPFYTLSEKFQSFLTEKKRNFSHLSFIGKISVVFNGVEEKIYKYVSEIQ